MLNEIKEYFKIFIGNVVNVVLTAIVTILIGGGFAAHLYYNEVTNNFYTLESEDSRARKRIESLTDRLDGYEATLSRLEESNDDLKRQIRSQNEQIETLSVAVDEFNSRPSAPGPTNPRSPSSLKPKDTFDDCDGCGYLPTMVAIPGGSYRMGSPPNERGRASDGSEDMPDFDVTVSPFAIAETEITYRQWKECENDGGCPNIPDADRVNKTPNDPMNHVTWNDAQKYIKWLNNKTGSNLYRLPSEAEWQHAAKAGSTGRFYWEDSLPVSDYANRGRYPRSRYIGGKDLWGFIAPVAQLMPNEFGLYDVAGNVFEWTADCFVFDLSLLPRDGSAFNLPTGEICENRTMRGGSYTNAISALRLARRAYKAPNLKESAIGFRVARDLAPTYVMEE